MKTKQHPLCFFLGFLSFFSVAFAQSPEPLPTIKTRLVSVGINSQLRGIGIWQDEKFTELWIPSGYFPEPVDYEGPNTIRLVSMVATIEGVKEPIIVGQAEIPEGVEEALLLLTPLPVEKKLPDNLAPTPRYSINVMDFSPGAFPKDSFLIWNLTERPVVGTVADSPFEVAANEFSLLKPEKQRGPKALDVKIQFSDTPDNTVLNSSKWFTNPGQKYMIIILTDPKDATRYKVNSILYK